MSNIYIPVNATLTASQNGLLIVSGNSVTAVDAPAAFQKRFELETLHARSIYSVLTPETRNLRSSEGKTMISLLHHDSDG